jgi:hypothetical protein
MWEPPVLGLMCAPLVGFTRGSAGRRKALILLGLELKRAAFPVLFTALLYYMVWENLEVIFINLAGEISCAQHTWFG